MTRLASFFTLLTLTLLMHGPAQAGAHKSPTAAGSAHAGGGHHGYRGMGGDGEGMDMLAGMGEKLGLSDTQKQDLGSLLEIYRPRFEELAKRGQASREQLLATTPDGPGYSALTDEVSAEAGRTAAEVVVLMAELQTNAYSLLTNDQQAKYLEMRTNMRERMQTRRDEMRAGGKRHHGHGKHGDGQVCEHGEDGMCPHHPAAAEDKQSE
jgi:Spy/CpxP family protein refolding chaperone